VEDFGHYHVVLSRNQKGWVHDMAHRRLYVSLILLLFNLSMSGCQSAKQVSLDWADGDIVFVSDRISGNPFGPLFMMDAEGRNWAVLRDTAPTLPRGPAWSPDGNTLAFEDVLVDNAAYHGLEGIVLLNSTWGKKTYGPCRHSPAWSPDAQLLAFYTDCGSASSLSVATPTGQSETELVTGLPARSAPDGTVHDIRISWAADSQHIAYDVRNKQDEWEVWIVSRDGSINAYLTQGCHPSWSPLGSEIAFARDGDIWVISVETKVEHKLVDDPVRAEWPAWSPDGQQLVFVTWRDDVLTERHVYRMVNTEIYQVNRDGSELVNLTHNPGWDAFPAWRPALNTR
jgi:Tol biopolymer transport system component